LAPPGDPQRGLLGCSVAGGGAAGAPARVFSLNIIYSKE
jgi:hypothetical protein